MARHSSLVTCLIFDKYKKCLQNQRRSNVLTVVKTLHVAISLSGEHLGSDMQKCTPDLHHRMKCDDCDVLGMRKCVSGECPKHILIFEQIREFRILYVYNGQSDTHVLRDEKSIVFVVRDVENHLFSRWVVQQKRMVGHDFLNFPFYRGNIRLKLKCSDCTLLSDGIAKHQNIKYSIGF